MGFDKWIRAAGLGLLLQLGACAEPQPGTGEVVRLTPIGGEGIQPRPISLYLPPGYNAGDDRYPVIYAMDGQNLFEPGYSYGGVEWGLDETMDRLIAEGLIEPAIIVGVWNTADRAREYVPQAVFANLPASVQDRAREDWGGALSSDAYLKFLVDELKPLIDARYRTRSAATSTGLMGSSMGGLISLYGLFEHPDRFSAAAGLSTHWPLHVDFAHDDTTSADARRQQVLAAWSIYFASAPLDPERHRLWLDHGTINLDSLYPPYQAAIDDLLAEQGFDAATGYRSAQYIGADHNEAAWQARLADPLIFLLGDSGALVSAGDQP